MKIGPHEQEDRALPVQGNTAVQVQENKQGNCFRQAPAEQGDPRQALYSTALGVDRTQHRNTLSLAHTSTPSSCMAARLRVTGSVITSALDADDLQHPLQQA